MSFVSFCCCCFFVLFFSLSLSVLFLWFIFNLEIEKWVLCGGSWGSTLALSYARKTFFCTVRRVLRDVCVRVYCLRCSWCNFIAHGLFVSECLCAFYVRAGFGFVSYFPFSFRNSSLSRDCACDQVISQHLHKFNLSFDETFEEA